MTKSNHLGTALTAVSLIALAAGCAGPGDRPKSASIFGTKVDTSNIALATRAQLALAQNDVAGAIPLAERAVEGSPRDAGFRALLGNCYLAAGRFFSAEAAYRDSLSLMPSQPQLVLKLALVQIAQGNKDQARLLLAEASGILDPADAGLALALAGDPQSAVALLEQAARSRVADARTRQNLALAHAFAGDWLQARTVAAQDLPADQVDVRMQQWMELARPGQPSTQVAAFIGVQPVAGDPGQPVRLALHRDEAERLAEARASEPVVPVAVPSAPAAEPQLAEVIQPEPLAVQAAPAGESIAVAEFPAEPLPAVQLASEKLPEPVRLGEARPALSPAAVRLSEPVRKASARRPAKESARSGVVVQLGAYSSRERIAVAWDKVSGKYDRLNDFTPVTARFTGAKGTVYRLSVRGFASERQAIELCESLKRTGRDCFVRHVSGDAPVQFASR